MTKYSIEKDVCDSWNNDTEKVEKKVYYKIYKTKDSDIVAIVSMFILFFGVFGTLYLIDTGFSVIKLSFILLWFLIITLVGIANHYCKLDIGDSFKTKEGARRYIKYLEK